VVQNDDAFVFRQLLEAMLQRLKEQNQQLMLIGLHQDDPLLPVAQEYSGREYLTNLYIVYWPDEAPDVDQLRQRVPYLELGCL
jgi:hypothetical protein